VREAAERLERAHGKQDLGQQGDGSTVDGETTPASFLPPKWGKGEALDSSPLASSEALAQ
jgi:hypothetical protein